MGVGNPYRINGKFGSASHHDTQLYDPENDKRVQENARQAKVAESQGYQSINNEASGKTENSEQFNQSITDARESRSKEDKWRVDVHSAQEYDEKGCKMWKSNGGSTVAVTSEGDIISVCKHSNDTETKGRQLLEKAVQMGGIKLDSFAGNHDFYTRCGFEPVAWTPFNVEYAPDGWRESGQPEEPVVFYKYVGKGNVKYTDFERFKADVKPHTGENGYDDAYRYRDSQLKKKK